MSLLKQGNIFPSEFRRNNCEHVSVLDKNRIHEKAGQTAIPVRKWVDKRKPFVELCRKFYRVVMIPLIHSPRKQIFHFIRQARDLTDWIL